MSQWIMQLTRRVNEVSLFSDIVAARTKISTLLSLCDAQNTRLQVGERKLMQKSRS